ncbi:MAG: protein kinase [Dactylosporangium sp.]|nr:protein kinase family protein [Dactylosporangium sp.]NNJ61074.1 protein kinase [Dactylosporangium sp.]
MAHIDEGHEAHGAAPRVLTLGSPTIGEILADRYQVEEHLGDDAHGRQMYRGVDVVLRRPVTIVLRHPGGDSAREMLAAAVAASRVVHPHLVGVYDAIDEGTRAYVVREWIDGISLREAVAEGPLDAARAVAISWAVADAVSALHDTGVVHGNVHPGTVMIAQDGRVMLADARVSDDATEETDVRSIGGVLYSALTGFWPHAEAGPAPLPDGVHDNGMLLSPGEVRPDLPAQLNELVVGLLDPGVKAAPATTIAAELALMTEPAEEESEDFDSGLGLAAFDAASAAGPSVKPSRRKLATVVASLVAVALIGVIAAMQFSDSASDEASGTPGGVAATTPQPSGQPSLATLSADRVRIVLGPTNGRGDRSEVRDADKTVDGDVETGWKTDHYNEANFGQIRPGLGVWVDLGSPQRVVNMKVYVSRAGATMELRGGDTDPGAGASTAEGDAGIVDSYRVIAPSRVNDGTTVLFTGSDTPVQYLLVWITKLPPDAGRYGIKVSEIEVTVQ